MVAAVVSLGVEDADRERTWLADAADLTKRGSFACAREVAAAALGAGPPPQAPRRSSERSVRWRSFTSPSAAAASGDLSGGPPGTAPAGLARRIARALLPWSTGDGTAVAAAAISAEQELAPRAPTATVEEEEEEAAPASEGGGGGDERRGRLSSEGGGRPPSEVASAPAARRSESRGEQSIQNCFGK